MEVRVYIYDFFAFCKEVFFPFRIKHFGAYIWKLSAESAAIASADYSVAVSSRARR